MHYIPLFAKHSTAETLYGARYDFSMRSPLTTDTEYMLAALPRSGSTYLSIELRRTGLMGAPLEYPNPPFANIMRFRFGSAGDDLLEYWDNVRRLRTSPNGFFGYKMFVSDYALWVRKYPFLLAVAKPQKVVFITRSDHIAQAVSYSRAIRYGEWFDDLRYNRPEVYDYQHTWRCMCMLQYQESFWTELFARTGAVVYNVIYEDLVRAPNATVRAIGAFLGVELDSLHAVVLPRLRVQRDGTSGDWIRRFARDLGASSEAKCASAA